MPLLFQAYPMKNKRYIYKQFKPKNTDDIHIMCQRLGLTLEIQQKETVPVLMETVG